MQHTVVQLKPGDRGVVPAIHPHPWTQTPPSATQHRLANQCRRERLRSSHCALMGGEQGREQTEGSKGRGMCKLELGTHWRSRAAAACCMRTVMGTALRADSCTCFSFSSNSAAAASRIHCKATKAHGESPVDRQVTIGYPEPQMHCTDMGEKDRPREGTASTAKEWGGGGVEAKPAHLWSQHNRDIVAHSDPGTSGGVHRGVCWQRHGGI